jgi:hypothetical protein
MAGNKGRSAPPSSPGSPPPPPEPPNISRLRLTKLFRRFRYFREVCADGFNRFSVFGLAILATIASPCLPIVIEWYRTGDVKADTYYLTAAVLASAFAVTAEHNAFRGLYIVSFVINLIVDTIHGPFSDRVERWAGILLATICVFHMSERFWWHIFQARPFPDR